MTLVSVVNIAPGEHARSGRGRFAMHPVVFVLTAKSGCSKVAAPASLVDEAIGDERAAVPFSVVDAGSC
jgi:hypothetical protein